MKPLGIVFVLLAAQAGAQTIAPEAGVGAQAWVGPVAGAIGAAGTDHISSLGSVSLLALSNPGQSGRLPFVKSPEILTPLVAAVQNQGYTPETFAALATPAKLAVLKSAAAKAEAEADAVAAEAVAAAEAPLDKANRQAVETKVAAAEGVSLYLAPDRAEQVAAARAAVKKFEKERRAMFEAFMQELPGKISAGDFTASNLINQDKHGWRAADEGPETHYASLSALYDARLKRIENSPAGPWTAKELSLLKETLDRQDIAVALDRERPGSAAEFQARTATLATAAAQWAKANPGLSATLARFEAGKPRVKDIADVEKLYENASMNLHSDWTGQSRILAGIHDGGAGAPSWGRIQELRAQIQATTARNVWRGLAAYISAMIAMFVAGFFGLTVGMKVAAIVLVFLPLIWFAVNIWRRDSLSWNDSYLGQVLRKYFPDN